VQQVLPNGTVVSLQGVDAKGPPINYTTDNNTRAAATIRTNELWTGGALGLNLSSSYPALAGKLGMWDGGAVRPTHQQLAGRTANRDASPSPTPNDHATHVAGTMIAKGVNPLAKGMFYTSQWSNGATTATTSVSPSSGTTYTVTTTDALGCKNTASVKVSVINARCGNDPANPKVLVCSKGKVQCVNPSEVPALLSKGGKLGACGAVATRESAQGAEVTTAQVVAFPNPFSRTVIIDIRPETSGYATYQVTSPRGVLIKRLFAGQVEAGQTLPLELDGSNLSSGVYVGRYVSNGEVHTTKLILKK
jgi:hypothetical protein